MSEVSVVDEAAVASPRSVPPLTVLIVTMDRRDILEKTLWYLYETSTDDERDIWVWDNASEDDTPDFLGTLVGWPGVRVFRSKVDFGVAGPRRRMIPHVRTPYILTLDDDWWMLNRGWASGVSRVLDGDPTICQVALGASPFDETSDYGVSHHRLGRPFFRVPPLRPGPKADVDALHARIAPPGTEIVDVRGERVVVPLSGTQLPFSCSGGAAAWRTSDILPLVETDRRLVADLRDVWSFPLQRGRGMRESTIVGYGCLHPSPGPLWHLGGGERYWEERCRMAEEVYGRSAETQRSWLAAARVASGWGRVLDDPDEVLAS